MANEQYYQIAPQVGIQRDGTSLDTQLCIDAQWCRFYKGRPKKMGGYTLIYLGGSEIIRDLFSVNAENSIQLFNGYASSLITFSVFLDLTTTSGIDRTPLDFVVNPDNIWSFTTVTYLEGDTLVPYIVAVAIQNGSDIANSVPGQVYAGLLNNSGPLVPALNGLNPVTTTGGVFALESILVVFGENGGITWNDGSSLDNWPAESFTQFGTSKIVFGAPVRSGDTVAGLLWALDSVINMQFNGNDEEGNPTFNFSYASTNETQSILSSNCVVSYDPYFYWIGVNAFYWYNGSVSELENEVNKVWFFENLNQSAKQKVRGFVNKKYNEVWWLFPYGDSTENNWAIIYNTKYNTWYDTPINRSCGLSSSTQMPYPLMASSQPVTLNLSTSFPLWAHEFGVNQVTPVQTTAINSYFTSNKIWAIDQGANVLIADTIIPDIKQVGNMLVVLGLQGYPNSSTINSPAFVLTPTTEFITLRQKATIFTLTFLSNELDGDFLLGNTRLKLIADDDQRMGPSVT